MQRRHFLAGLALGVCTRPVWAEAGAPAFLSAGIDPDNRSWLVGLSVDGAERFRLPLPARGHAAAAHPTNALAVAFARRPGRFALVIDCKAGRTIRQLDAPTGHHFYGHGAFSQDGALLLTTENHIESGEGRIGLWDVNHDFARMGALPSGGVGPHEIIRLPDGTFAVANGGILTHPDHGRAKLNLPTMRPNLAYLTAQGDLTDIVEPPIEHRQNSIRHIAADSEGRVAIALQWQGKPGADQPVAARHLAGGPMEMLDHPDARSLKHYAGSVAIAGDGSQILVTGPKGNRALSFDGKSGQPTGLLDLPLASGVAAYKSSLYVTTKGALARVTQQGYNLLPTATDLTWDNHLIAI